jgi:hypothetical protein
MKMMKLEHFFEPQGLIEQPNKITFLGVILSEKSIAISTINPAIYYPCQKHFVFIIDYSNGLSTLQFNVKFCRNYLFKYLNIG